MATSISGIPMTTSGKTAITTASPERTIHIFSCGYNCQNYIQDCYDSILANVVCKTKWWVMDDCSLDNTWGAIQSLPQSITIHPFRSDVNRGPAYSKLFLMRQINKSSSPNDIAIQLDLDDFLMEPALEMVLGVYNKHPECMMTFGNFTSNKRLDIKPYTDKDIDNRSYLKKLVVNKFKPLRSMSTQLLKYVRYKHIVVGGKLLQSCTDFAIILPLVTQLRSWNIKWLEHQIYYYRETPINTNKIIKRENIYNTLEEIKSLWRSQKSWEKMVDRMWENRTI